VITLLVLGALLYSLNTIDLAGPPHEDAAMLMRYSENLAGGDGIVWNRGERPLDGATDFLPMVMVAALIRMGLTVEASTRGLALACHLLGVAIVYLAVRRRRSTPRLFAVVSSAYLAAGPGIRYVEAYFLTPVFTLSAAVAWYFASAFVEGDRTRATACAFAASSLVMGIIRPEGVFLAAFMLAAVLHARGASRGRDFLRATLVAFGVLGASYFIWRWSYFGQPLPNAYYMKGGGLVYIHSPVVALMNAFLLLLPFAPIYALSLLGAGGRRRAAFSIIPLAGFCAVWLLVSNEMNYLARFQYAILPIALISWPSLLPSRRFRRWLAVAAAPAPRWRLVARGGGLAALLLATFAYQHLLWGGTSLPRDGRSQVGRMLRDYAPSGHSMATSEAGLLPLYSRWRALDAWGLNDREIAHGNGITVTRLAELRPDLIVYHACPPPATERGADRPGNRATGDRWSAMTETLRVYAATHGYTHAASFGLSRDDTHEYWVRSDSADAAAIVLRIRGAAYPWYMNGEACLNYATTMESIELRRAGFSRVAGAAEGSDGGHTGPLAEGAAITQ
jgi:hypothetical protein